MIDWIKRAWRGWFGPKRTTAEMIYKRLDRVGDQLVRLNDSAVMMEAAREATIAQKNLRLASIARTRDAVKREIARLKRNKKKHSHMMAELARLTRLELELESGK